MKTLFKLFFVMFLASSAFGQGATCQSGYVCNGAETTNGDAVILYPPQDAATVVVNISGTWSGTISFKGSNGGVYVANTCTSQSAATTATTTTANDQWRCPVAGLTSFEAVSTASMTGSATVTVTASKGSPSLGGGGGSGTGFPVTTTVQVTSPGEINFATGSTLNLASGSTFSCAGTGCPAKTDLSNLASPTAMPAGQQLCSADPACLDFGPISITPTQPMPLPTGSTAVTQTTGDSSTKIATDQFVAAALPACTTAGVICAASYGVSGAQAFMFTDGVTTSSQNTLDSATAHFNTNASVGMLVKVMFGDACTSGTSHQMTSVPIAFGTIASIASDSEITMSVNANASHTGECFAFGTPQDTALSTFDTAYQGATACPVAILPAGVIIVVNPHFTMQPTQCTNNGYALSASGIPTGATVEGTGVGGTILAWMPNSTTWSANCANGVSGKACWNVPQGAIFQNFAINGLGDSLNGTDVGSGGHYGIEMAAYSKVEGVTLFGLGASATHFTAGKFYNGVSIFDGPVSSVDAFGNAQCSVSATAKVSMLETTCVDAVSSPDLTIASGGFVRAVMGYFAPGVGTSASSIVVDNSGSLTFIRTNMDLNFDTSNKVTGIQNETTGVLSLLSRSQAVTSGGASTNVGLNVVGGTVYLDNATIAGGASSHDITCSGGTVYDLGGNIGSSGAPTTSGCTSIAGNYFASLPLGNGGSYQTVDANGTAKAQEPAVNFISGSNATVSCSDNSGSSRTDCTIGVTPGTGTFYQTVAVGGSAKTQEPTLNLIQGTNASLTCIDNVVSTSTDCTIGVTPGLGTFYQTVQVGGSAKTQEPYLNFTAGMACVDNSGSTRTDCTPLAPFTGLSISTSTTVAAGATWYMGQGLAASGTEANEWNFAPNTGTLSQFQCGTLVAPGTGHSVVFTLRVNQASPSSGPTCTVSNTNTTCSDSSDTAAITLGQPLDVQIAVGSGATSTSGQRCSVQLSNY